MPARNPFVWLAVLGSAGLALPLLTRAEPPDVGSVDPVFPFPVVEQILDNGLRVVVIPMDSPGLVAHYLVVRTGSRNEVEPGLSGFAHFFEHMMFRGTDRYPPEQYNDVLKRLGADSNAFTTDDWTCYHIAAASTSLEKIMEIESDRFMNLEYSTEAFQKEAGAVLGEYNKNYSVPINSLFEKLRDTAYEKHTYKHTTMGFLRDIEDMPNQYAYSLEFFKRWYRPDNCALVVAGDVKPAEVFTLASKHYGSWKAGAANLVTPTEPPQRKEKTAHVSWKNPTLPMVLIGYHAPAFSPDAIENRVLDVLSEAAFSETSPLYKDLVLEKQWVDALWGGLQDRRDPSLFLVMARVKEPSKMNAVIDSIYRALEGLGRDPLPTERIEDVKSHIRYAFLQSLSTPDDVAGTMGHFLQLTGETSSVDRAYRTIERVTAEDVRRAAEKTFRAENRTVVTLSHDESEDR